MIFWSDDLGIDSKTRSVSLKRKTGVVPSYFGVAAGYAYSTSSRCHQYSARQASGCRVKKASVGVDAGTFNDHLGLAKVIALEYTNIPGVAAAEAISRGCHSEVSGFSTSADGVALKSSPLERVYEIGSIGGQKVDARVECFREDFRENR